jgi:hypothetical protein
MLIFHTGLSVSGVMVRDKAMQLIDPYAESGGEEKGRCHARKGWFEDF